MSADPEKSSPPPDPDGAAGAHDTVAHNERVAQLFEQYHAKLVKSLVAKTRSWDEAREIAAQAFAELLALDQPGKVSFLGAYLYRTARNLLQNRWKAQAVRRRDEPILSYDPLRSADSPEPEWSDRERVAVLHEALERLPARAHTALVLRVWHELPYTEIVARFAAMGVKLNVRTVERDVAFAIHRCRQALDRAESPRGGRK